MGKFGRMREIEACVISVQIAAVLGGDCFVKQAINKNISMVRCRLQP